MKLSPLEVCFGGTFQILKHTFGGVFQIYIYFQEGISDFETDFKGDDFRFCFLTHCIESHLYSCNSESDIWHLWYSVYLCTVSVQSTRTQIEIWKGFSERNDCSLLHLAFLFISLSRIRSSHS